MKLQVIFNHYFRSLSSIVVKHHEINLGLLPLFDWDHRRSSLCSRGWSCPVAHQQCIRAYIPYLTLRGNLKDYWLIQKQSPINFSNVMEGFNHFIWFRCNSLSCSTPPAPLTSGRGREIPQGILPPPWVSLAYPGYLALHLSSWTLLHFLYIYITVDLAPPPPTSGSWGRYPRVSCPLPWVSSPLGFKVLYRGCLALHLSSWTLIYI